jgi:hypothetical protein
MTSSSGGSITSPPSYTSSMTSAPSRSSSGSLSSSGVLNGTMPATSKGPIIGGVLGGVLGIALVTGALFLVYRRGQRNPGQQIPERHSANLGHWNGRHDEGHELSQAEILGGLRYPDEERLGSPREDSESSDAKGRGMKEVGR